MTAFRQAIGAGVIGAVMAGGAQAQTGACPTGFAVDGIYLTFSDRVTRYERFSNGITAEYEVGFDGSFIFQYRTYPVGLLIESWEEQNGRILPDSLETINYTGAPLPVADPTAGTSWAGVETAQFSDGSVNRFDTALEVSTVQTLFIGTCQYTGLPIRVERRNVSSGSIDIDALVYINELGIVLYLGTGENGVDPVPEFPTAISDRPPVQQGSAPTPTPATPAPQPAAPRK